MRSELKKVCSFEALAAAFVLRYDNNLIDYDWASSAFERLRCCDPKGAYECMLNILSSASLTTFSTLGATQLKPLLEASARDVLDYVLFDVQSNEPLRYSLASAMAFGLYTGNSLFDEELLNVWTSLSLRNYYLDLCKHTAAERDYGELQLRLGSLFMSFQSGKDFRGRGLFFDSFTEGEEKPIRVFGLVALQRIKEWRADLERIYMDVSGKTILSLGHRSRLTLELEILKTGIVDVSGNFWINSCLMPQLIDLELDQTHLKEILDKLNNAISLWDSD